MGAEIGYNVSYRCPHCQAPLEGRAWRADAWLRCPKCGRASLPPSSAPSEKASEPAEAGVDHGVRPAPDSTPVTILPASPSIDTLTGRTAASPARVFNAAWLFVAVSMFVFSYLDGSFLGSSVFSALAVLALVLLVLPPKSGR